MTLLTQAPRDALDVDDRIVDHENERRGEPR